MIAAHPTEGGDGRSFKREGMEPGFRRVEAEVREVIAACGGAACLLDSGGALRRRLCRG